MGLSVGKYNATLTVDSFRGIREYDNNDAVNTDMRYASQAKGAIAVDGTLQPFISTLQYGAANYMTLSDVIIRSAVLFNRRKTYNNQNLEKKILLLFGKMPSLTQTPLFFTMRNISGNSGTAWSASASANSYSQYISAAAYDGLNSGGTANVDIMYATTQKASGLMRMYGDTIHSTTIFSTVSTPYKFSCIERYGERIWGTGDPDHPDIIAYSAPYDPADWSPNASIPEDGAGEVQQPTFDGEPFTALKAFGNSLLAFKRSHIWRITGLSPDEYVFQEQYGGVGTIFPNTIAEYHEQLFFLTENGVYTYDGAAVRPFQRYAMRNLWKEMNIMKYISAGESGAKELDIQSPTGVVWDDKYIISFPGKGGEYNNIVVQYDFLEDAWSYRENAEGVAVFVRDGFDLYTVEHHGVTSTLSAVKRWYGAYEKIPAYETSLKPSMVNCVDWVSPWTDFGNKDLLKTDFQLRFRIKTKVLDLPSLSDDQKNMLLRIVVETERGEKVRDLVFTSDCDEEIKLRFHATGKRVRFKIYARNAKYGMVSEVMYRWFKIMGGLQFTCDVWHD